MRKIVGSIIDLSTKAVFSLDKYLLKNMGWKLCFCYPTYRLEDLKVLRRSPDLLNNVKIGHGQLQLIMEQILFFTIYILVKWPKQSNE